MRGLISKKLFGLLSLLFVSSVVWASVKSDIGIFTVRVQSPEFLGNLTGNADSATALSSNPTDCGSNAYAISIDASGNLTCAGITNAATTATSSNSNNTIVLRDGSGNFSAGVITGSLTGSVTGNADSATALASNPTDCLSDTYATTIAANGNLTCAAITNASTTATATNSNSTIVLRDGSGNFAASTITAALSGNASTSTALASDPSDCGSNTYATTIAANGNLTCASITNASTTATSSNTNSTIVLRDGSGNFSAGTITAALTGNASTATALASNPTDCSVGLFANAIDASGNLTCASASGGGVTGPGSSTDNAVVRWDGTAGTTVQNSSATIDDNGAVTAQRFKSTDLLEDDTTWYTNTATAADSTVIALAEQTDGKVLVGGSFTSWGGNTRADLVRINADGTEDTSFYTNLVTGGALDGTVTSIAIQADQKIVIAGNFTSLGGATVNRIARLNTNGTVDTTFVSNTSGGAGGNCNVVRVQADGKILLGGSFTSYGGNTRNRLVRINSDGTEDTTFASNFSTGFGSGAVSDVALQSDQKIIVVGTFTAHNSNTRNRIVRLSTAGVEDATFYSNTGAGFGASPIKIQIQSDDKILIGGSFTTQNGNTRQHLVRLSSAGVEDSTYYTNIGTGGVAGSILAMLLLSDQSLIISGGVTAVGGSQRQNIARISSTGAEEQAIGNLFGKFSGHGFSSVGQSGTAGPHIIRTQDGGIIFTGTFTTLSGITRNRIAKLKPCSPELYLSAVGLVFQADNVGGNAWTTTAGQYSDAITLDVTPGFYKVSGHLRWSAAGAITSTTGIRAGVGTTAGDSGPATTNEIQKIPLASTANGANDLIVIDPYYFNVAALTTYRLKRRADGAVTNLQYGYRLTFERISPLPGFPRL